MSRVQKITLAKLDNLHDKFNEKLKPNETSKKEISGKQLNLVIAEQIYISKTNLPQALINFLREELNFINSEFLE